MNRYAAATLLLAALTCCAAPSAAGQEAGRNAMTIHYLEIVTPDPDAHCGMLAAVQGLEFGPAVADLGGARTAKAAGGMLVGVRASLAEHEQPVVRVYTAVEDIGAAVKAAEAAGGVVAYPPTVQGDTGTWAIVIQGGIQHGLWQR